MTLDEAREQFPELTANFLSRCGGDDRVIERFEQFTDPAQNGGDWQANAVTVGWSMDASCWDYGY